MNRVTIIILKVLRKLYSKSFRLKHTAPKSEQDPEKVSYYILRLLLSDQPCMIARFGATELNCISNYICIKLRKNNIINYIKGNSTSWWWEPKLIKSMQEVSGFFPASAKKVELFCELMLQDIPLVDILASWQQNELFLEKKLKQVLKVRLMYLDPFWSKIPWTKALKGKKVLVVHPFAQTILSQYQKREFLFDNKDVLPEFQSLSVVQAVQSLRKADERFKDWFEALNFMKSEIEKHEFDICLIGCGAYGFPLAAHVKRMGKKAVHMGGSLQLLFGIRGKRWEVHYPPHYEQPGNVFINYHGLPNDYWVRPSDNEKPENYKKVENSAYW